MKNIKMFALGLGWAALAPIVFVFGLGLTGVPMIACSFLWGLPMGIYLAKNI